MALADITPADMVGETANAKLLASQILGLAAYLDQHSEALWAEHGESWVGLTNAQKNMVITQLAAQAKVAVSTQLLGWIRQFIDLVIGDQYKAALLAKLQARLATLQADVAQVQARIDELTG